MLLIDAEASVVYLEMTNKETDARTYSTAA